MLQAGAGEPRNDPFLARLNPGDLFSRHVRRDPYTFYSALRLSPQRVHQIKQSNLCLVSRRDDVEFVLRNPTFFSSTAMAAAEPTLLGSDPPTHAEPRAIVDRALTEYLPTLKVSIDRTALRLVAAMSDKSAPRLMSDLAIPLTLTVIAEALGLAAHVHELKPWRDSVVGGAGDQGIGKKGDTADQLLVPLIEHRRAHPRKDLVSMLLQQRRGWGLSNSEVSSIARLLLVAGSETTTNLIGNAVARLHRSGRLNSDYVGEPSNTRTVIEETLQFDAPVQFVRRIARRDVDIAGCPILTGTHVLALIASANRDEVPQSRNPLRMPRGHLAFGAGPH